ncbi:MAG: sigma 54-interacting transcriptional regulator [Planctomycetota bacterium]
MQSEDLKLRELVEFGEGEIDLHGRRLVLHSLDAFAQFRRDLAETVGEDQTRRILTRFGYFWGQADAAAMTRIFEWDDLEEWLRAGARMQTLQGVGRTVVESFELSDEKDRLSMELLWHNSGEAEEQLLELGKTEEPACWILVGYASGYASFCMGKDVYFVEQECRATGDAICRAVGQDADSWGPEAEDHREYFQAEEIQGKILSLTEELKRKTRQLAEQRRRTQRLERDTRAPFAEVRSKAFARVIDLANRVASYDSSLVISGESGVGKEVLARYIHRLSHREDGPFVPVNCGALPETLLESELFGHVEGAFTGATEDRSGFFEEAEDGTLFLDEVADMSPQLQLKLLRALQEKEVRRVGESTTRDVNCRVMAATNKDLDRAMEEGRFREDLYYRLAVIEIEVPPLRHRRKDILPLARYFVDRFSEELEMPDLKLDPSSLQYLRSYDWPGNVRELENAVERAAVLSRDDVIRPEDLPPAVRHGESEPGRAGRVERTLAEMEMDHIERVLEHTDGNKTRAAEILDISPSTLWRKLKDRDHEE